MIINQRIGLAVVLIFSLSACGKRSINLNSSPSISEEQNKINLEKVSCAGQFTNTPQEEQEFSKWEDGTQLIIAALTKDRGALYLVGAYYFLGSGNFPLDVRSAEKYFAESASLGFAPALYYFFKTYIQDSNPFLALVYDNLMISYGHAELIDSYHNARKEILDELAKNGSRESGRRILNEIERIALHKRALILKNQNWVQEERDSKKLSRSLVFEENIIFEDYQYDKDYWRDVYKGEHEVVNRNSMSKQDKAYLEKLYNFYYSFLESLTWQSGVYGQLSQGESTEFEYVVSSDFDKVINDMQADSYSEKEIEKLKRQARSEAKKTYKLICKFENDTKEAERDIQALDKYLNREMEEVENED